MGIVRTFAQTIACTLVFGIASVAPAQTTRPASPTLREAAGDRFLIGTAISAGELNNAALMSLITKQFHGITAVNEMKPDSLQRVQGQFTFERADRMVEFARANNIEVIGHTLCWHSQSPRWLFQDDQGKPLPREVALANLKTHITTVVQHFKGKVKGWDVVNEAINDGPQHYLRDTPARRAIGDDFVLKAFEFAQAADPDVELYYNDYNIELDYKRERALRLVREIRAAGLRLDAVGIQGHWMLNTNPAEVERGIKAFADEGFKVMITEMDVDVLPRRSGPSADLSATEKEGLDPYKQGLPPEVQQQLADRYTSLFEIFNRYPVTRVTFWGTHDGGSWLNGFPVRGRTNHPLLFDRQLQPKPAYWAVIKALQSSGQNKAK